MTSLPFFLLLPFPVITNACAFNRFSWLILVQNLLKLGDFFQLYKSSYTSDNFGSPTESDDVYFTEKPVTKSELNRYFIFACIGIICLIVITLKLTHLSLMFKDERKKKINNRWTATCVMNVMICNCHWMPFITI